MFWLHLTVTILAWIGPFLFSWRLMVLAYLMVLAQFYFFNRCLMNARHDLAEENDNTFYAFLLERAGFRPNRKILKFFIRKILYLLLALFTLVWQVGLGFRPLFF